MALLMGQIVGYKMRVPPTRDDPRGVGGREKPRNITDVPAIILRVVTPTRLILSVFSYTPFVEEAEQFDPLKPKPFTWFLLP